MMVNPTLAMTETAGSHSGTSEEMVERASRAWAGRGRHGAQRGSVGGACIKLINLCEMHYHSHYSGIGASFSARIYGT